MKTDRGRVHLPKTISALIRLINIIPNSKRHKRKILLPCVCARVCVGHCAKFQICQRFWGQSQSSVFHGGLSVRESTCVCMTTCFSTARIGISGLISWPTLPFRFTDSSSAPTPPPPPHLIMLKWGAGGAGGKRTLGFCTYPKYKTQICAQNEKTWSTKKRVQRFVPEIWPQTHT